MIPGENLIYSKQSDKGDRQMRFQGCRAVTGFEEVLLADLLNLLDER